VVGILTPFQYTQVRFDDPALLSAMDEIKVKFDALGAAVMGAAQVRQGGRRDHGTRDGALGGAALRAADGVMRG